MQIQLFNLETMSGVFPGVRTQVFQRIALQPTRASSSSSAPDTHQAAGPSGGWAQLFWYEAPPACVLYAPTDAPHAEEAQANAPLVRFEEPQPDELVPALESALQTFGWQMVTCGRCRFWQNVPDGETTADGIPLGVCQWRDARENSEAPDPRLTSQSALALGCAHWEKGAPPTDEQTGVQAQDASALHDRTDVADDGVADKPVEKRAADTDRPSAQHSVWGRIRALFARGHASDQREPPTRTVADRIVERSGVGAGAAPCFGCQGRIANLGALVVETPEGDKQTLSVWRCRLCHTYYLNNWIDRWERLDNLETEETYYRIAPAEALLLLQQIESVPGGDHPGERLSRSQQRDWFEQFVQNREPLSHQVKLGR